MDIYFIKQTTENEVRKDSSTVIADCAFTAIEKFIELKPYDIGDKYSVRLPEDYREDSGWKAVDYDGDLELEEHLYMRFSIGICQTEKGSRAVLLFSPSRRWEKNDGDGITPLDLLLKWL